MDPVDISIRIADQLATVSGHPAPRLRLWEGTIWGPEDAATTLVLRHPGALRAMLLPPNDLSAGEAYVFDDVDVEGDIIGLIEFASGLAERVRSLRALNVLRMARRLPASKDHTEGRPRLSGARHSLRRDRTAIQHHYDTGDEFFGLFLDPLMVYSSAYFLDPKESLDTAQRRKLDVICRKLELSPGMRFLDVGCGWGALVVHAAAQYGVEATGVTLSSHQAEAARQRAKTAHVEDGVTILERDYREIEAEFDAIASVGMFEHVGRRQLPVYFRQLQKLLAPGGQLLNHGIVTRDRRRRQGRSFVRTYVFPDGELVPVDTTIRCAEQSGFELRDAESLRAGYALTLRRWLANLERNADRAKSVAAEQVYRIWRLYIAGSVVAFETSSIDVFQLLLSDPRRPWTFGRARLLAADDLTTPQE